MLLFSRDRQGPTQRGAQRSFKAQRNLSPKISRSVLGRLQQYPSNQFRRDILASCLKFGSFLKGLFVGSAGEKRGLSLSESASLGNNSELVSGFLLT